MSYPTQRNWEKMTIQGNVYILKKYPLLNIVLTIFQQPKHQPVHASPYPRLFKGQQPACIEHLPTFWSDSSDHQHYSTPGDIMWMGPELPASAVFLLRWADAEWLFFTSTSLGGHWYGLVWSGHWLSGGWSTSFWEPGMLYMTLIVNPLKQWSNRPVH